MENIIDKKLCTGCTACLSICPKKAISFKEDTDGFKYPVIDKDKCIDCGLCKKKCPVLNTKDNDSINDCYVGFNKDDNEKLKSSSGGHVLQLCQVSSILNLSIKSFPLSINSIKHLINFFFSHKSNFINGNLYTT